MVARVLAVGCGGAAVSSGALSPHSRHPDVVLLPRERTYTVQGATAAELAASMTANSPFDRTPRPRANHHYQIRWRYTLGDAALGCEARTVRIEVDSEITLPEWTPPAGVDSTLVAQWMRFMADLRTHEEGHRGISLRSAEESARELRQLRTPTCASWRDAANRLMDRKSREQRIRQ